MVVGSSTYEVDYYFSDLDGYVFHCVTAITAFFRL